MKPSRSIYPSAVVLAAAAMVIGGVRARAAEETVQSILAAQIRSQGFSCDKAVGAARDATRSRPDHAVWVLRCSNASFRVSRAPDMAAKVEPLR
ncbi:hypothetical protein [Bradyrhizobium guangzhouense]|uniref:Uncharacterized protein n=1 Tax=Bradyrhizobium guangzhouense TaxID=1325095 RepID=A0AAE6CC22_9BRAD|nr:hypothetical protein [Bradyrhizobium guangzhouense]QAU50319.1 hypothetical protein XH91_23345 [Bradyrhizobium guangzhouense]RXH14647.1 hypothetical protein EAS56_11895 [Bradyrhizobium guangzhouense]